MELIIKNIGIGIMVTGLTVANWFGVVSKDYFVPEVREVETKVVHEYLPAPLGASVSTPDVKALFTTSLASKITSSATSMTLVSATDKDGTTLASSTYGFILDEGTSVEEFVLADCTGTACTNMTRGISVSTATTSVAALKFEHRRGASVKITTAPSLVFVMNVLKGKQSIENKLRYSSTQTFNNATDIISRDYADSLAFGAIPASSETASGFVELATTLEGASSTSSGSAARLAIPASSATSTYNSATAPLRVVVTQNNGKIDPNFMDTSSLVTLAGNNTFTGGNIFQASTTNTATSTFAGTTFGTGMIAVSTTTPFNFGSGLTNNNIVTGTIKGGTFSRPGVVRARAFFTKASASNTSPTFTIVYGGTTILSTTTSNINIGATGYVEIDIAATSSASSQVTNVKVNEAGMMSITGNTYSSINGNIDQPISFRVISGNDTNGYTLYYGTIEKIF